VLDRLNAVVEPGGVLAVGERGALIDGSVRTIQPHKDFRLFFTMDPRHGTISRFDHNLFDNGKKGHEFVPENILLSLLDCINRFYYTY